MEVIKSDVSFVLLKLLLYRKIRLRKSGKSKTFIVMEKNAIISYLNEIIEFFRLISAYIVVSSYSCGKLRILIFPNS